MFYKTINTRAPIYIVKGENRCSYIREKTAILESKMTLNQGYLAITVLLFQEDLKLWRVGNYTSCHQTVRVIILCINIEQTNCEALLQKIKNEHK